MKHTESRKKRLLEALAGASVDRPPVICPGGMMNMVTKELMDVVGVYLPGAHQDARLMTALAKAVVEEGLFENVGVPFCMTVEAEAYGATVDLGNEIYEPHVVNYPMVKVGDWKKLSPIDLGKGRPGIVLQSIRHLSQDLPEVPVIGNLTGPISIATSLIEPVVFYKALRKNPAGAHEFLDFITQDLIAYARAQIEAGTDVIAISDPSGSGEILGPDQFREFCVQYINRVLEGIADTGIRTIVHICGQMKKVFPQVDLLRSDALSFDSVVPISLAKTSLNDRILMGNVSTYTLEFGEIDRIKIMTAQCVQQGADIISPACGLGMRTSLDRIRAMLKVVEGEQ